MLASLGIGVAFVGHSLLVALELPALEWPRYRAWYPLLLAVFAVAILLGCLAFLERGRAWLRGSWQTTALGSFRLLFCLLVLASGAILAFLQPFQRTYFDIAIGAAFAAFLGLFALARWLRQLVPVRVMRWVDLGLFNACLLVVVTELGLRAFAAAAPSPLLAQFDDSPRERIAQHRLAPGKLRFGFRCNERGYYDETPRRQGAGRETLVVAIGDSFAVGILPHYFHFTTVCERRLEWCEIYNVGVNAAGPAAYRILIEEEALPLQPAAVLLCLFVGNDIGVADRGGTEHRLLRRFYDRDNVLVYLLPKRLMTLAAHRRLLQEEYDRVGRLPPHEVDERSPGVLDEYRRWCPWLFDCSKETPTYSEATFWRLEKSRAFEVCSPRPGPFARLFTELERMRTTCRASRFLVLLLPDEFQVEDELWERIAAAGRKLDRDRPQRVVGEWLAARGIACLDLLPVFRRQPPEADGNRHLYHLRDTHLNARGNRLAGEALAEFLARELH